MDTIATITRPINHYVQSMIDAVESGEMNPLELYANLKKASKIIDSVLDSESVKDAVMKEYQKYGTKEVDYKGITLVQSEVGAKFDYSGCQDHVINDLESRKKALDDQIKARQKFLKNLPSGGATVIDEETGEVNTLYPPSRSSSTIIKATIR